MKYVLLICLVLVGGCGGHSRRRKPVDVQAKLIAELTATAKDTTKPVKERQKAIQQLRKLGITDWGDPRPPNGRIYLLER